jgi:hypothetical protein
MAYRIDPTATVDFHDRLATALPAIEDQCARSLAAANGEMHQKNLCLARQKPLEVALSALLLDEADVKQFEMLALRLHALIEQVLDYLIRRPDALDHHFPDLRRIFPFFAKTSGLPTWQALARYDAAVQPDGGVKIMELNTACPGAFMISEAVSQVTQHGFQRLDRALIELDDLAIGSVRPRRLRDKLLGVEEASGIEQGTIGILHDENELSFELRNLADSFRAAGREAILADARELKLENGRLTHEGRYLSLVYNKFRISTPNSPNHCWRDGFESRYSAFLEAQKEGLVVSVNNLVGLTVGESKALLAVLRHPEVQRELSDDDKRLIENHVLWTARLQDAQIDFHGEMIDLLPYVLQHRERFVIKPANEGRGFGVVVGKYCDAETWTEACQLQDDVPQVVQEYAETLTFPVVSDRFGRVTADRMFLTVGLSIICGSYEGVVSRISASPVTNVAREGFGQAVFVSTNNRG